MVYLIVGENAYVVTRELASIVKEFGVSPEYVDSSVLTVAGLADLVRAQSLFADRRLIVCRGLSENKSAWEKLAVWVDEVSDDTALVLIESKLDKRTKAYKSITAHARVIIADQLSDRDWRQAESWLDEYAHSRKVALSREQLHDMVQRAHVPDVRPGRQLIDQQLLAKAVDALAALPAIDEGAIAAVMPYSSIGTVFDILEHALAGDRVKVEALLQQLRRQEDAHAVFPSLINQWVQAVEVALVGTHAAEQLGIHPYVVQKIARMMRDVRRDQLKPLTALAARLDADLKRSSIEPWDAVDRFVLALIMCSR